MVHDSTMPRQTSRLRIGPGPRCANPNDPTRAVAPAQRRSAKRSTRGPNAKGCCSVGRARATALAQTRTHHAGPAHGGNDAQPAPLAVNAPRERHLGARREQLLVESGSQVLQMRALLECVWPAALATARQPFRSSTWTAAMRVVLDRDGGDLARTRRLGLARLETAVRWEIARRGKQKPCLRIVRLLFAALTDPAGVIAHRPGALERVALLLGDWLETHRRLLDTETRMTTMLDELRLTELATSITGLSTIGAAAILAETGDPNRFDTARALVKHAGLAPREKLSGTFVGRTKLTGQGRPGLRLAAWRAVWGAQRANPVYAARFVHLTTRQHNRLTVTQAQAVIAAAILRQLHAVITTGQRWDPVIATHGTKHRAVTPIAA
jgi:transposase